MYATSGAASKSKNCKASIVISYDPVKGRVKIPLAQGAEAVLHGWHDKACPLVETQK